MSWYLLVYLDFQNNLQIFMTGKRYEILLGISTELKNSVVEVSSPPPREKDVLFVNNLELGMNAETSTSLQGIE